MRQGQLVLALKKINFEQLYAYLGLSPRPHLSRKEKLLYTFTESGRKTPLTLLGSWITSPELPGAVLVQKT